MQSAHVALSGKEPAAIGQRVRPEGPVIARSLAMREILGLVRKIARANVPVLIQGEIGTGKQTIAREIHRQSPRAAKPFVHVVCGSLRESDLEERLFGPSRDDSPRSPGVPASLLEPSRYSTLFLDGVTQLPFWAQVKLLDALQCGGGRGREDGAAIAAEARVIASATCDLQTAVAENRFFSGLYYYLNAVRIDIPPLRHRQEDIRRWRSTSWLEPPSRFGAAAVKFPGASPRKPGSASCSTTGRATSCNWPPWSPTRQCSPKARK